MAANALWKARSRGVADVMQCQTNIQSYNAKDESLHFHLHCAALFMLQLSSPISPVPLFFPLCLFWVLFWALTSSPCALSHRQYKRSHYAFCHFSVWHRTINISPIAFLTCFLSPFQLSNNCNPISSEWATIVCVAFPLTPLLLILLN